MRLGLITPLMLGWLLGLAPFALGAPPAVSLVPRLAWVSADEARLLLADLYWRTGDAVAANSILTGITDKAQGDAGLLLGVARLQAGMGHAARSRDLFERSVSLAADKDKARLAQAQAMNLWGDFYRSEAIYRDYLKRHPNQPEAHLALARVLMSAQRYEEAEAEYLNLLDDDPADARLIMRNLCELKWTEKDLDECLGWCELLLTKYPEDPVAHEYRARVNFRRGKLEAAAKDFTWLADRQEYRTTGLLGLGQVYEKQELPDDAAHTYTRAFALQGANAEAVFRHLGADKASSSDYVSKITKPGSLAPPQLKEWAGVYREHGLWNQAVTCYRASLDADPEFFPARLDLAETLAINRKYDEANEMLAALAVEYPGVSKVMLTRARALAWSERYKEAIDVYLEMHRLNPNDKVPLLEAARAAAWDKDMDQARELYGLLLEKPVSAELASRLSAMGEMPSGIEALAQKAAEAGPGEGIYRPYEELAEALAAPEPKLDPATLAKLEKLTAELRPRYRVQKAAHLEMTAKTDLYEKRPLEARETYRNLAAHEPGNQEALFDLGQAQCALGLCYEEQTTYASLLELDPLHNRAGIALERALQKRNPLVHAGYSGWSEKGRGGAADITRHRADAGVEVPLSCRFSLSAVGHQWWELPHSWGGEAVAQGFTLAADGRINPWLDAHAAWTRKMYQQDNPDDLDLGRAWLGLRLKDFALLKLGWTKEDVVKNAFSLRQGTTQQDLWLSVDSDLTRELEAKFMARYQDYSDDNQGVWTGLNLAYALLDHPNLLKLALQIDYRDYRNQTEEIYEGDQLVEMNYPYWTPLDWLGGELSLIYRHDYSPIYVCGAELRYYELRLSVGTDTEGNAMAALEAAWHHECWKHWTLDARGLLHRSDQWDANGVWLYLGYRF